MRLAMVLDESTLYPVWYDIIPGNILDISTLTTVTKDVEISLDIKLNSYTLDAGYASKELIQNFEMQKEGEPIPEKRYLVRMPAKKGFPHKELYNEMKDFSGNRNTAFCETDMPILERMSGKLFLIKKSSATCL